MESERASPSGAAGAGVAAAAPSRVDDLLNLDIDQLSRVRVGTASQPTNLTAPSSAIGSAGGEGFSEGTTPADVMERLPGVTARRTSAINLDPRIRGYQSSQINASAGGVTQLKTRVDIDSLFSQIDPGVVSGLTVIDGPYTALYGPGFAFLTADLLATPRYAERPETHFSTTFSYGTNGDTLYTRENVLAGGRDWGAVFSYGLRVGSDYHPGGDDHDFFVPASYKKWDTFLAFGHDLTPYSRVEFNFLRTEMNDVELPGVVYDLNNSTNDQFSLRYIVQEDRHGPEQLVLQSWWQQTHFRGDALRPSKQQTLYHEFLTLTDFDAQLANTVGVGRSDSLGVRLLRTFGEADGPQWTVGADWRRTIQRYDERDYNAAGELVFGGDVFGIPRSHMDDVGALTHLMVPLSDRVSVAVGGRVDAAWASLDASDPVITQINDPADFYYEPGYHEPGYALGMAYVTAKAKLDDHCTANAGTGFAMRPPNLAELYANDPYVPLVRFGNSYVAGLSTLDPEQCWQADIGLTLRRERWNWMVRGFHSTIRDYILPVPAFVDMAPPPGYVAPRVLGRDFSGFLPQWRQDLGTVNENSDTPNAAYQYVNLDLVLCHSKKLGSTV